VSGALGDKHRADLEASGLTPEAIAAGGFYTEADPVTVGKLLNWKGPARRLGPCLVIPFLNPDGTPSGYCRVKPGRPREKAGKRFKYESPVGQPNRAYLPPLARAALADPSVELLLTEGEKKSAAADRHGFVCIGLTGVWSWQVARKAGAGGRKAGRRELIPDLAGIAWRGRRVSVVFDSDAATNDKVRWAEWHLARTLAAEGAEVRVVRLPPGPDGAKVGLDDYLLAHDADALRALLAAAGPAEKPSRPIPTRPGLRSYPPPEPGEAWGDPGRLARLFADDHRTRDGAPTLVQWRDEYHEWDGAAWRPVPDSDLDARLARHCRAVFEADYPVRLAAADGEDGGGAAPVLIPVTTQLKANVRLNLAGLANHPDGGDDPPFWLPGAPAGAPPAAAVIAAPNGLFTLDDIAADRGPLAPPTPALFTPTALPFPVPPAAPRPAAWLAALDRWFDGDAASIAGLQEFFGYALTADTSAHVIGMMVGPPRSGKGTIIGILTDLVGERNVASTNFAALGETFGLEDLVGKRVAVIPDARLSGRTDAAAVVERLLSISGEDRQTVNRKNRRRVSTRLAVRFLLATNEVPRLPDASGAVASRFLIFRTPHSWLGKEDRNLKGRLQAELPGVLRWAAEGWVRLVANVMRFTPNAAAAEYRRELEDLSSPVRAFLRWCCTVGPAAEVDIPTLYAAWREWNDERHREVGSEQMFGRDLRAALPHLETVHTNRGGERRRVYRGVGLRPRDEWGEADPARDGTRSDSTDATAGGPSPDGPSHPGGVGPDRVPSRAGRRFRNDDRPHGRRW
jgi:putative DNA primase/helicase